MFFAVPIRDVDGTVLAVLTQRLLPGGRLLKIMRSGRIGQSGESYIIDREGVILSESRFREDVLKAGISVEVDGTLQNLEIRDPGGNLVEGYESKVQRDKLPFTKMAADIIRSSKTSAPDGGEGPLGEMIVEVDEGYRDYRGVPVFGAWQWDSHLGLGIATEIDKEEALAGHNSLRFSLLVITGLTLLMTVLALLVTLTVGERATRTMRRARDDLEERVADRTQDLMEREARLSSIIDNATDGIITINTNAQIQSFSRAAEQIFGYTQEEVLKKNINMLMPDPFRSEHDGYLHNYFSTGQAKVVGMNREVRGLHKDGTEFPMDLAVGESIVGDLRWFTGIVRDITDRKQAEAEIIVASDKAEAATRSKASFLAAMSHEIRTPMNGVVGMISLLQETKLDSDQRMMMNTVQDSAFSLLQIINDILDFSKIEAGKMSVEKIPVNLDSVMEGVGETLLPNVTKKNLRLALFVDPDIPDHILTDQVRLRQILFNLAGNATKFTENNSTRQGRITLRADLLEPMKDNQALVRFSVMDNGIGMNAEAVDKLFVPFTQADQSTTRKFGGTGLGLSICKNLVDLLGGKIAVESEPGEGSAFHVTLSFAIPDHGNDNVEHYDLSETNIAYAVSYDESAEAVERYCQSAGARVQSIPADDVINKVREISNESPLDVLVLGTIGDKQTVEEMVRTLREDEDLPGLRFLLLTPDRSERYGMILPDKIVVPGAPIRKSGFLHGVAMAIGRASPEVDNEITKLADDARKVPEIETARAAGELILIAEDNLTNQDVIKRQLNVLGYACEVADDGVIALEMLKAGNYGMLLTDCHMPNMDGYELTAALRNQEMETDQRLPVVAITANALQGEAERCLASGMDDYLAKPLEMAKLKSMLGKWLPVEHNDIIRDLDEVSEEEAGDSPGTVDIPDDVVVDIKALTDIFGDDMDTVKEILADFIQPSRDIIGEIDAGFEAHSADAVGKAGHKLKSSSRAIGANALADLCFGLEQAGKNGNWDEINDLHPDLHPIFDAVASFIEEM